MYIHSMFTEYTTENQSTKQNLPFFVSFGIKYILCISWCRKNQCMAKHIFLNLHVTNGITIKIVPDICCIASVH